MTKCDFCGSSLDAQQEDLVLGYPDMEQVASLIGDFGGRWDRTEDEFPGFAGVSKSYHADWKVCTACYDKVAGILASAGALTEKEWSKEMFRRRREQ